MVHRDLPCLFSRNIAIILKTEVSLAKVNRVEQYTEEKFIPISGPGHELARALIQTIVAIVAKPATVNNLSKPQGRIAAPLDLHVLGTKLAVTGTLS